MSQGGLDSRPSKESYDVVIVGGAIYGASTSFFLTDNPDFTGSVLVVERDPTYEFASTSLTNSCIRQQFSEEINVRISQFGAAYIKDFRNNVGGDERVPDIFLKSFGYLYLAASESAAQVLRECQAVQAAAGAGTKLMTADDIHRDYPFYHVDDIVLGSHNLVDEGHWDGPTVFDWWRRLGRERGIEYVTNEVVAMSKNAAGDRIESVTLKSGEVIACDQVVNASGPRAVLTSRMAGIEVPVEPRKRYSYIFAAEKPLDRVLPLTIDPSGVHMRQEGVDRYLCGCPPDVDPGVDYDDFEMDHSIFEEKVWPVLAHRVPQFEAIKVTSSWVGHYAYNVFDQNAIVGPHPEVRNFIFLNGFSGHGLQQSPAIGRGMSELLTYGEFRSLDLSPFRFERILENKPFLEKAII